MYQHLVQRLEQILSYKWPVSTLYKKTRCALFQICHRRSSCKKSEIAGGACSRLEKSILNLGYYVEVGWADYFLAHAGQGLSV